MTATLSPSVSHYRATGFSMEPFILDGDDLILSQDPSPWLAGDILLYRSKFFAQPVAHRLLKIHSLSGALTLRADAHPEVQESVPPGAVIGKVILVRRQEKLLTLSAHGFGRFLILQLYPLVKKGTAVFAERLEAFFGFFQSTPWYRRFAKRRIRGPISVAIRNDQTFQIVSKVRGRLAGTLILEKINHDGIQAGWISSVYVRIRYRGAGLASQLLQAAESQAKSSGMQELWLGFKSSQRSAKSLYMKQGFQMAASDLHPFPEKSGDWDQLVFKRLF